VVDTPSGPGSGGDAGRLAALLGGEVPMTPASRADVEAAQREVAAFLSRLGSVRLRRLALLHPALMTSALSAPVEARTAACRVLVSADLARLWRSLAGATDDERLRLQQQLAQRQEWLTGTVALRRPDGAVSRRPHQLLAFDPRGDGQVVELLGDARTARRLTVFVPGTGSDLERYPGSLRRMTRFAAADPSLAVVLWQGADFPDQPFDDGTLPLREHVLAAAYRDAADVAGPRLAAEVAGLRIALPGPACDLTVVGHSYGGSVVGSAEAHGMRADRVVHVASAGTYTAHPVAEPGVEHFSMTAYDDPIRLAQGHDLDDTASRWKAVTPWPLHPAAPLVQDAAKLVAGDPSQVGHGADPDLAPGVVRLDTGRYDTGRLVHGHSDMFTPGSTAFRNLLAVMTGRPVEVLEPARWSSHLEPAHVHVGLGGAHVDWAHYVVDRSPWTDPGYASPTVPTVPTVPTLPTVPTVPTIPATPPPERLRPAP
jgi:hypothetical protein